MSALIKFEWQRDSAGYHVEKRKGLRLVHAFDGEVKVEEFVFLSEVNEPWSPVSWDGSESDIEEIEVIVPNGGPLLTYYPLEEEPSLFAILAATKLNSDSVLTFVNRFGPLHHGRTSMFVEYWDSDIKNTSNFISAIEGKNYQIITDYFCNDWASGLRVRFDYTTGRSKPQLCLTPPDLRSAIYLQLAQHISSDRELRRCLHCGTGFVFGSGTGRRRSGHYCSDRCRKAAWFASKENANG